MSESPYTKEVTYAFKVNNGEYCFSISSVSNGVVVGLWLEDTRKNGQEDCHEFGEMELIDGRWEWFEESSFEHPEPILQFIRDNPPQKVYDEDFPKCDCGRDLSPGKCRVCDNDQ